MPAADCEKVPCAHMFGSVNMGVVPSDCISIFCLKHQRLDQVYFSHLPPRFLLKVPSQQDAAALPHVVSSDNVLTPGRPVACAGPRDSSWRVWQPGGHLLAPLVCATHLSSVNTHAMLIDNDFLKIVPMF